MRAGLPVVVFAVVGCAPTPATLAPPCLTGLSPTDSGEREIITTLSDDPELRTPTRVQVLMPAGPGRYADGAPVAVFVHGAWRSANIPIAEQAVRLQPGHGIAQIYLDLPDDLRGIESRAAVAAALRYAAGWIADDDGCMLDERARGGLSGQRALAGFSNGGNLAWAALARGPGVLPAVDGVVTFETPIGSQLVVGEPGTEGRDSPLHAPGLCDLEAAAGDDPQRLVCDYDYADIRFDDQQQELYLELDGAAGFAEGADYRLPSLAGRDGLRYHSGPARRAAAAAGLMLSGRATLGATEAFWAEREAPQVMAEALRRQPELAVISVGAESDHVLIEMEDHPHVTGMVAAAEAAGARWWRVNPDAAYAAALTDGASGDVECDAMVSVQVGEAVPLLPTGGSGGADYLTAATLEVLDRAHQGDWRVDLEEMLYP